VRDDSFLGQPDALSNPDTAALAAALSAQQSHALPEESPNDFRSIDRQWWVGLKRKLYGWDRQFAKPLVSPLPINGPAAMVVHEGTDQEAGVFHEKVQTIGEMCRKIVGDVGEPVSICLVRHGVVFFHHAYGELNGRPFTVDDAGDIMSATKPLGGALMMQVLDSGVIQPDEAIDKVLPCFANIPVKRPMTIRDLYTHLNGLTGDWGDQIHDTEEIVAGYYSTLDIGNYSYNEVGFALGGKVIEAVTGEAFAQFAKRHLLTPLGMDHTRVTNSGGHNATTSLDYARFGQMLLNKGSYGTMRFFSQTTFNQMLPSSDGSNRRGMGLIWMNWQKYGFGDGTFGHGAGNSSMLVVDPVHDLVMVIVSGGGRKDFRAGAEPFYQAVINALD
jgi:CubicO group peptidase (beta-lactamase class C family)